MNNVDAGYRMQDKSASRGFRLHFVAPRQAMNNEQLTMVIRLRPDSQNAAHESGLRRDK
jgi:hypothetical protein